MGCFNMTCAYSGLHINPRDEIYIGLIYPSKYGSLNDGATEEYTFWKPMFEGKYDDYGLFVTDNAVSELYLGELIKENNLNETVTWSDIDDMISGRYPHKKLSIFVDKDQQLPLRIAYFHKGLIDQLYKEDRFTWEDKSFKDLIEKDYKKQINRYISEKIDDMDNSDLEHVQKTTLTIFDMESTFKLLRPSYYASQEYDWDNEIKHHEMVLNFAKTKQAKREEDY